MQSRSSALRGSNDILRHELTETAKKNPKNKNTKNNKKTIKKNIPPKKPYNLPPDHYTIPWVSWQKHYALINKKAII